MEGKIMRITALISSLLIVLFSLTLLFAHQRKRPLTYQEKKKVAKKMKKIAKALGVKCKYCHTEAKKGLRAGDFTILTDDGKFAHDVMFPLAKRYKVTCDYCHNGKDEFTDVGERAQKDMDAMEKHFKKT
ncbi:MAG: hypothetical protein D6767_06580, partial [Candidatus Hydrogenedentota bacterium]